MAECPICATDYEEGSIEICSNCGFDLTPYPLILGEVPNFVFEREENQIASVKQMWLNFEETKQKLLETLITQSESHKQEINKLSSQLEQNDNTISQLNNQVKKLEINSVNLREELNRKIRDLKGEKDNLQQELKRRNSQVDNLNNKIKELEIEKLNLRRELTKTVDNLQQETRQKTVIQEQLKSAEQTIAELNLKNQNLATRYDELESKYNTLDKKYRDITNVKTFNFETVQLTIKEVVKENKESSGLFGLATKVNKTTERKIETRKIPKQAQYFTEDLGNGVTLDMVYIPGGSFMMRGNHQISLNAFYMSKYLITEAQYQAIYVSNAKSKWGEHPVENVSWQTAQEFCQKLSQKTGKEYQLPSETQWEYACRAGTTTPFYFGEILTDKLANYHTEGLFGKSRGQTTPVGTFPPNGFGLYDMHGNVWEWCADSWHDNYKDTPKNESAWVDESTNKRVLRGGSWTLHSSYCESDARTYHDCFNSLSRAGIRVVLYFRSSS